MYAKPTSRGLCGERAFSRVCRDRSDAVGDIVPTPNIRRRTPGKGIPSTQGLPNNQCPTARAGATRTEFRNHKTTRESVCFGLVHCQHARRRRIASRLYRRVSSSRLATAGVDGRRVSFREEDFPFPLVFGPRVRCREMARPRGVSVGPSAVRCLSKDSGLDANPSNRRSVFR
jgi:hypothetical protein